MLWLLRLRLVLGAGRHVTAKRSGLTRRCIAGSACGTARSSRSRAVASHGLQVARRDPCRRVNWSRLLHARLRRSDSSWYDIGGFREMSDSHQCYGREGCHAVWVGQLLCQQSRRLTQHNVVPFPHLRVLLLLPEARPLRPVCVLPIMIHVIGSAAAAFLRLISAALCCRSATVAVGSLCAGAVASLHCRPVRGCVLRSR